MALLKNEIGNKYGLLTVVDRAGSKDGYATWKCKCDCGNFIEVKGVNLRRKGTQSCGCLKLQNTLTLNKNKLINLVGKRFGNLTVLERIENKKKQTAWKCKCDCGTITEVTSGNLTKEKGTRSCGCISSKGEFKIAKLLSENNILFKKEFIFEDCRSDKNYPLRFDFGIIQNNTLIYLIEYHGEQHYKQNFNLSHEDFLKRLLYDNKKKEYCLKNNIPLIIIPYNHYPNLKIEDLLITSDFLIKGEN